MATDLVTGADHLDLSIRFLETLPQKTEGAVHAAIADFNDVAENIGDAGDLGASKTGIETPDLASPSVDDVASDAAGSSLPVLTHKGEIRYNQKLKQKDRELYRFHHVRRVVNIMFRFSMINKVLIIPAALLATSIIPESVMRFMSPGFAVLGLHIGIKASHKAEKLTHKLIISQPVKQLMLRTFLVLAPYSSILAPDIGNLVGRSLDHVSKLVDKMRYSHPPSKSHHTRLSDMVRENRKTDFTTTLEVTGALLALIDNLPEKLKIFIMPLYGVGIPILFQKTILGLLRLEHRGYELKAEGQQKLKESEGETSSAQKLVRRGATYIKSTHAFFGAVPWFSVTYMFYVSGRTMTRSVVPVSGLAHKIPVIGADNFLALSFTSVAATVCTRKAYSIACAPATRKAMVEACTRVDKFIEQNPMLVSWKWGAKIALIDTRNMLESVIEQSPMPAVWKQSAKTVLDPKTMIENVIGHAKNIIERQKEPDSKLSCVSKELYRMIYTPYLWHQAQRRAQSLFHQFPA